MPAFTELFPAFEEVPSADGMPTVFVPREHLVEGAGVLRDHGFSVLIDLLPIDFYPREPRYEITYLLLDPGGDGSAPARLRLKVRVPGNEPTVPTVSGIWRAANWAEREAWDFFGIMIEGHPDLRRILMPDDWEGHPMRKDYPVQIKDPVKTYAPLQLTPEEFAANIDAARERSED